MIRIPMAFLTVLFLTLTLVRTATAQNGTVTAPDSFQERLATLDKLLEAERIKNNIPGFAIAIVKDDEVVFSNGYGHRNLETKQPVESDTLFAIGSSTKAFTGALVAMLVDEGKMDWDDPVTRFLPEFKMKVDTGDEQITIRDLLCHRTGFTRMGLLWASGALTREEIIEQAAQAQPYADFQEKFLYNNVMYMAAGMCAGRSVESDWDTLIAHKIFKPLRMDNSSTTIRVAQNDSRMSLGYQWDEDKDEFIHLPMKNIDSVGPAGSINSNVNDMTAWLRFQLSKGHFDDQQLLSEKQHAETWKKQMKMAGKVNYGFGWMLRTWNGKKVVEHGGSIDGFGAQVTLLPELNTGYVLLTNVTTTPFQQGSISLVFDTLFGEAAATTGSADNGLDDIDTESLVGKYIANFGPFNNATMEVLTQNGSLAIDVPGQQIFELNPPDEDGKWYFAKTNAIAISFNKDEDGKVISITLYQGGAEPEFVREDVELEPESPLTVTAPLIGSYRDNKNKNDFEVVIRNGRLVINKGRSAFTFLPPDENGKWALRPKPKGMQIRFNKNDDGTIKSLTWFQGGNEIEMPRISEADSGTVPSIEELLAKMREGYGSIENSDIAGIRMIGSGNFVHQGAQGTVESTFSNSGQYAATLKFGRMATINTAFDGKQGFSDSNVGRYEQLSGRKLKLMELSSPLWFLDDWKQDYQDVSITGEREVDGKKTFAISLSGENVPNRTLHISADSGLILKEKTVWISDKVGEVPIETTYSDYRTVNGIQLPFKTVSDNPFTGKLVTQFESATTLTELPQDAFVIPPPQDR